MKKTTDSLGRRSFMKATVLAGGGMLFSFQQVLKADEKSAAVTGSSRPVVLNGYIRIAPDGKVTLVAPNPEFGQNVKTSLPMIVAEELDADWATVSVEQAPFDKRLYQRQFAAGSGSVRGAWNSLREAGAKARHMLRQAAAKQWNVPVEEVTTEKGKLLHLASGRSVSYGEVATAAAKLEVPGRVELKKTGDFHIVRTGRKNVDGLKIVTGQAEFGVDYHAEGMLIAMITHPPAFGLKLKSFDDSKVRTMPGVRDVFTIETQEKGGRGGMFDTNAFPHLVVIVGDSTWQVMQAKKALVCEWEKAAEKLESSEDHKRLMDEAAAKPGRVLRKDGDPDKAFAGAAKVVERTYTAPFLAHNAMEPLNFFAHITDEKAFVAGPLQAPEWIERTLASRLGMPVEKVEIKMTRMGGGFGRRAYGHFVVEAALISQKLKKPVKLLYSREDDMTFGVYRPMYRISHKAGLDADGNLVAYAVKGGGIPESPVGHGANRFPAGAVDHYVSEEWSVRSAITVGAFRAPASNFLAFAEQSFLDEVAKAAGKDPIDFRLALLDRAKKKPVGRRNDYEADRYAGVLKLVKEKSGWGTPVAPGVHRGVAAYFCHASYVAHVVDLRMQAGKPVVEKVTSAVDCGIVVNPDAASNMVEGAVVDAIGNALFGEMTFKDGAPQKQNYHNYRMIRFSEAPKKIEVHFVQNDTPPTGLGEPPFPPAFAAFANALSAATGTRHHHQPFAPALAAKGG